MLAPNREGWATSEGSEILGKFVDFKMFRIFNLDISISCVNVLVFSKQGSNLGTEGSSQLQV